MLDTSIIFKMAGMGLTLLIVDKVLKNSGKEEVATSVDIVGVIIILGVVLKYVSNLFTTVKALFQV